MVKINLHRRFDFNIARGSYFGWVKFLFSSKHGINYPYKLIYNSNNRLFVTTKALSLLFKVDPKYITDIKEILRDINTNGNNLRNLHMFFESLISILPLGRGFMAQPTYWDLRDRGTYSSRGFIAYKPWSLCPSLFYMGFNNTFIAGGKDGEKWVKY